MITESGGEASLFEAPGVLEETTDGTLVRYLIEGDDGELLISDTALQMHRRGRCALQATFCEGEETQMILGDLSLHATIPVRTTRYLLQRAETGASIELCYELFNTKNIQVFSLKIQLFFSEEK